VDRTGPDRNKPRYRIVDQRDTVPFVRWDDAAWRAWRPEDVARRLAGIEVPWCIAAGWAVDLFVGHERREHEDIEIAAPARAFPQIRARLDDLEFYAVGAGEVARVDEAPERLDETHQTWGLDPAAFEWRIDVFREPSSGSEWICRRDRRIRLRYGELIEHTTDGIPFVRPEVALLFKAKAARDKDEEDLRDVLRLLGSSRRGLLRDWLGLVHPGHRWLDLVG
jgi:hypothetical protein